MDTKQEPQPSSRAATPMQPSSSSSPTQDARGIPANPAPPPLSPAAPSTSPANGHRRRMSLTKRLTEVMRIHPSPTNVADTAASRPPMSAGLDGSGLSPALGYSLNPDDYEIQECIGFGSSATVHRALYKPLNKRVAIKMIDLDLFERNQIDELRRELQIMTLSRHANLLPVHGSFVHDSKLYIVAPYLAAGSLLDILRNANPHGIEEVAIATVLKEALQGMEYLHKNGHIHRDVKAGNLLMDDDGTVLLADFGVSASLTEGGDRKTQRKTFVGTPCWMAPEVLSPERGYDSKADIWSFGITAIELATGQAPFAKYPPLKVLMMTLSHAPPTLHRETTKHKYSKSFKDMIDACLQKDPTKRPTATKLLQHSFFRQSKGKEYLVKTLLKQLLPLEERQAGRKPVPKEKIVMDRGVSWDFTSSSSSSNETVHSMDDAYERIDLTEAHGRIRQNSGDSIDLLGSSSSSSSVSASGSGRRGHTRSASMPVANLAAIAAANGNKAIQRGRFQVNHVELQASPPASSFTSSETLSTPVQPILEESITAPSSESTEQRGRFQVVTRRSSVDESNAPSLASQDAAPALDPTSIADRLSRVRFASDASTFSNLSMDRRSSSSQSRRSSGIVPMQQQTSVHTLLQRSDSVTQLATDVFARNQPQQPDDVVQVQKQVLDMLQQLRGMLMAVVKKEEPS